jgi:ribosomal protein S14
MISDRPSVIRFGSPCPKCGGRRFESFAFLIGERETPAGPRSFWRDWARCATCGAPLLGADGRWTEVTDGEFARAVALDREIVQRVREQLRAAALKSPVREPIPKSMTRSDATRVRRRRECRISGRRDGKFKESYGMGLCRNYMGANANKATLLLKRRPCDTQGAKERMGRLGHGARVAQEGVSRKWHFGTFEITGSFIRIYIFTFVHFARLGATVLGKGRGVARWVWARDGGRLGGFENGGGATL